jgi:hypothetical protein
VGWHPGKLPSGLRHQLSSPDPTLISRACTNHILPCLKHIRLRNTFHTVIFGMPNSLLAIATDLRWLRWHPSRTLSMLPSDTRGPPGLLPLYKQPVSTNCRYHLVTLFLCGASFLNSTWNSRCTVITNLDTSKRSTQKAFSCCDAILEMVSRPRSKHEKRTTGSTRETWTVPAPGSVCCDRVGWEIIILITFETEPFFCAIPAPKLDRLKEFYLLCLQWDTDVMEWSRLHTHTRNCFAFYSLACQRESNKLQQTYRITKEVFPCLNKKHETSWMFTFPLPSSGDTSNFSCQVVKPESKLRKGFNFWTSL